MGLSLPLETGKTNRDTNFQVVLSRFLGIDSDIPEIPIEEARIKAKIVLEKLYPGVIINIELIGDKKIRKILENYQSIQRGYGASEARQRIFQMRVLDSIRFE